MRIKCGAYDKCGHTHTNVKMLSISGYLFHSYLGLVEADPTQLDGSLAHLLQAQNKVITPNLVTRTSSQSLHAKEMANHKEGIHRGTAPETSGVCSEDVPMEESSLSSISANLSHQQLNQQPISYPENSRCQAALVREPDLTLTNSASSRAQLQSVDGEEMDSYIPSLVPPLDSPINASPADVPALTR